MLSVSINILTYNRAELLRKALLSVQKQTFTDYEVVIGNNHSADNTKGVIGEFIKQGMPIVHLYHDPAVSITANRQSTLDASRGKYIATLDDDDQWNDKDKLKKQVEYLENHSDTVLVGGGIQISNFPHFAKASWDRQFPISKKRPETDKQIRKTMLLRNNFFTSTVMFRKEAAIKAGGFVFFENDYAEDYHLWLRLGLLGKMHNLQEIFTDYCYMPYGKQKKRGFFIKQLRLAEKFKKDYPKYQLARVLLGLRLLRNKF